MWLQNQCELKINALSLLVETVSNNLFDRSFWTKGSDRGKTVISPQRQLKQMWDTISQLQKLIIQILMATASVREVGKEMVPSYIAGNIVN